MNHRLEADINLHGILCVFWASRGMGTNSLKSKLLQQLMATGEWVLYAIFMLLHKAYDTLYRGICLGIL